MGGWTRTEWKPWVRRVAGWAMPAEQRGMPYRTAAGWGIRWYEPDGRRVRQAGFSTKSEARRYFEEQVRPRLIGGAPDMTLAELVDAYLDAHAVGREPRTIRTLRERLKYATDRFGDVKLTELERNPRLIATWTRTLPAGSRYGIVQALRQTLETAIRWRMISENPAKLAGRNPEPHREHVDPFEHSAVDRLAVELGPYGPLVVFAAETGLRPSEWMALERRDVDRPGAAVSIERTYADGRVKTYGKTMAAGGASRSQAAPRRGWTRSPRAWMCRCCFPRPRATTSTSRTSAPATGAPRWRPPGSLTGASTTCATRLPATRWLPAFPSSSSPATWAPRSA